MRSFSLAAFLAVLSVLAVPACRVPPPDTKLGKVIDCTSKSVQENAISAVGPVNDCLTLPDDENWQACLVKLINPAVGITRDIVACVLRDSGELFAAMAETNSGDSRSARGAVRARSYIDEQGYRFVVGTAEGGGPSSAGGGGGR